MSGRDLLESERDRCGAARMSEIEAMDYGMRWALARTPDLRGMTAAQLACSAAYNPGRGCDGRFVERLTKLLALRLGQ